MRENATVVGSIGPDVLFSAIREAADDAEIGLAVTQVDCSPPRVILVNEGVAKITGYTVAELMETPLWEYFPPEERQRLQSVREQRLRGGPPPPILRTVILRRSGERLPIEVSSSQIMLSGHVAIVSFVFDVSHRQRAEQALRESDDRFRTLIEGAPDGVAILRGATIAFLNPIAARMFGVARIEDAVGREITEFLRSDEAIMAAAPTRDLDPAGMRRPEPAEYRSRSVDGRELIVEISSIPLHYDGAPAVLAFARDITERRAMQARLVEADRLAALGVLSAGVAHEINNPLAYVLLNLGFLARELPGLVRDPSKLDELMERVRDASHGAERVASIVRDLRTFARGDESSRRAVDLCQVMDAALHVAGREIEPRARVVRDYRSAPLVLANANRLEQVFLNLLMNAAQAIDPPDPARQEIRVRVYAEGARVLIEVEDTGSGIAEDVLGRIFDPFFTTKPVGVGTGLGLPICRGIVHAQGGEISVKSRVGHGSTFTVSLPAGTTSPADLEQGRAIVADDAGRATVRGSILVVDDEVLVGRTLSLVLEDEHDLVLAANGEEAILALRRNDEDHPFDVILCDLMMPGMTGIELYERILREHPGLEQRMVFMTGAADMLRVAEFLESVDNPKFEKPFDLVEFRQTLRNIIRAVRAARS